jgi:hypothetical protein
MPEAIWMFSRLGYYGLAQTAAMPMLARRLGQMAPIVRRGTIFLRGVRCWGQSESRE